MTTALVVVGVVVEDVEVVVEVTTALGFVGVVVASISTVKVVGISSVVVMSARSSGLMPFFELVADVRRL